MQPATRSQKKRPSIPYRRPRLARLNSPFLAASTRSPQPKTQNRSIFSLAIGVCIWYKARRSYTLTRKSRSIMTVT
ncbi:hypothetical protein QWZ13_13685 [Reinekea marina]|uniref:hypothetical protein n=1 Tax=Reinekea marina TaxID=1310421 RepID=UPI0025B4518B|nr:hypothetical protein [Reinekea marina]MDN3649966.1 hypothetical protein [Reinekea marina]